MTNDQLKLYVEAKLADLKKEKNMTDVVNKGRLSFGLNEKEYRHLPSWQNLVSSKKKLVRVFWSGCFLMSFIVVGIASDLTEKFPGNWMKAIVFWICNFINGNAALHSHILFLFILRGSQNRTRSP